MTVRRTVVIMVRMFLLTSALVLVHTKDVTAVEYDDLLPATETNARQPVDTDTSTGEHRQGRMSLQAELPSSKAKREQALRNILAARRRQILSQRAFELSRGAGARTAKPEDSSLKDSSDVLEAQETRHGMYVTASSSRTESPIEDETSESSSSIFDKPDSESTSEDPKIEPAANASAEKRNGEGVSREPSNGESSLAFLESEATSGNSRGNYSNANGSSAVEPSPFPSTSSSPVSNGQKPTDAEGRKRNTVPMPESLYNYFRPVESNIPVEDMSQFLYFGQKLQPEVHNTTGNNSVEVTPTAPTAPSSRRRYSAKRYSSTTPAPLPKLEEIMNEEMNIAVDRQTVEKNKVSKIKNTFRSPESGLYYKKPRPTEPTIASNVILTKESGRNATGAGTTAADDKVETENPSAHAATREQLQRESERGSVPAHVPPQTWNATDSTQIPRQPPVSANVYGADERANEESEIRFENRPTDSPRDSLILLNGVDTLKRAYSGRRKTDNSTTFVDVYSAKVFIPDDPVETDPREDTIAEDTSNVREVQTYSDRPERSSFTTITYDSTSDRLGHPQESQSNPPSVHQYSSSVRESNNIETSTSRNKVSRSTTDPTYPVPWTVTSERPTASTLRIIVTEGSYDAIGSDAGERDTVKPGDTTEKRVQAVASGDIPTPGIPAITLTPFHANSSESRVRAPETPPPRHLARQRPRSQQPQQQHVYAYTITNVTRLLRNYTGPGLSKEYRGVVGGGVVGGGGQVRSSGTAEITTGSPEPQQSPPPPQQRSPPSPTLSPTPSSSPSSLLLPRAGSSIEAVRAPAELSAGTTVEPAAAGEPSRGPAVGERPRKPVVAVAQQSQQRAPARPTTSYSQQAVNKSGARTASKAEAVTGRGAIRWSYQKRNNFEQEGGSDRRFLRKSASAVLNQRVAGTEDDGPTVTVIGKRRRLTNGVSAVLGRRAKGANSSAEETIGSNTRPAGVNGSSLSRERNNFGKVGEVEDAAEGRALGVTMHLGGVNQRFDPEARTAEGTMEEAKDLTVVSNATESVIDGSPPVASDGSTVKEYSDNSTGTFAPTSENLDSDAKDRDDATVRGESESSAGEVASATSRTSAVSGDKSGDNGSGSPAVTVTESFDGTTVPKESAPSTTTLPTPVFPVTPRIIAEVGRVPVQKETFTSGPAETVNQESDTKTAESDRPAVMPANLDPSEIQKMYRSQNFTTTVEPTTQVDSQNTLPPQNSESSSDSTTVPKTSTDSPIVDARKNMTAERSPDVRARNLSDKSKDKDDVLPIMHLYNTSDIFNGSGPMDSFNRGAERPRVELPVDATAPSATEKAEETALPAKSSSTSPVPLPHSKEATHTVPRKEKHDENREPTPTGPGRGHEFVNGSSNGGGYGNRTRHRPVYHQPILPEYNGSSVYDNELNRTFFDAGLISVSPRESVNISEVVSRRHDGDALASQETIAVVSYILATLVVFPIAVGVGLILRRLILRNRKVLEESDTSSEISCRKDALNLENGDFKTSIEKAITKLPRIQHLCHEAEKPPPPPSQESRWEFPRDKLRLQTVLGQGNFGQVWKAEADDLTGHQGTTRLVAVKTVKEGASDREKEDLVRELEIMQQLGSHPNVVTLLGCCTEEEPHYLILEYVMYGKLLAYLRDHRTRQDFYNFSEDSAALTSRDLTVFGYCVARGMEYLASKKIIHRDLAARNVLVDHNKLCKIADFGMSRFANEDGEVIETRHGRNALPIRWMAPESLIYSLFTTKTDVWSFGILMWEIVTLGSTPYPDMTAREVMRNVQNGYRLERPSHCRSELFRVISRCWHADPDRRPEFQTLRRDLAQLLEDNMNGHYVDLESFASECTD